MKKQTKWLDNFGKADNANESTVSFSENFVGEGYDTKGRNYSPAWGGQFQTGGALPGFSGFMYARVADSNNLKSKNSKKTILSAQKGITSPSYKKGITNEILKRQAYKESTFNPQAVSPKGYKGLTQIGEDVIKDYMKKKENKKLDPFNPKDAVELQKFAMDDLYNSSFINRPNQSDSVRIAKTLVGYNWGRGNLFNYLGEQKKKGIDIYNSYKWLDDLPKESRDYVDKIFFQKDSSFNENYKKDSINPKYKFVNSLYDIKEFGGKVPFAQNGIEQDATRTVSNSSDKLWGLQRELDSQKMQEDDFMDKYGMSLHKYKMRDNDYASAFQRQMEQRKKHDPNYAEINLPSTDIRSKNYQGNPNLGFIPGSTKGESRAAIEDLFLATTTATAPLLPVNTAKIAKGAQQLGKYLTEETTLRNAYKLNPYAFKTNPEAYYRMIGDNGLDDLVESGVVRSNQNTFYKDKLPFFSKGAPIDGRYSKSVIPGGKYDGIHMLEVQGTNEIGNRFAKNRWADAAPDKNIFVARDKIAIDNPNLKVYQKDWLKGYKQIEVPKGNFKSEIDWAKWNKEIPENKALMQEYNAIEQQAKANGTWMKNPDGSKFNGTPEQFVHQNRIIKNSLLNPIEIIDKIVPRPLAPGNFLGIEDSWNNYSPLNLIPGYGKKLVDKSSSYPNFVGFRKFGNSIDDVIESQSLRPNGSGMGSKQIKSEGNWAEPGKVNENYSGVFEATMNPQIEGSNIKLEKWHKRNGIVGTTKEGDVAIPLTDPGLSFNRRLPFSNRYVSIDKQKLIDNKFQLATVAPHLQSVAEKYAIWSGIGAGANYVGFPQLQDANEKYIIDPTIKKYKEIKDEFEKTIGIKKQNGGTIGNNGMFDMTNPNIYKGLIPAGIATGLSLEKKQNGGEMKFYQEGLDWKPKSMQDGGQQPLEVSTSDPRYKKLYENRQLGRWLDDINFDSQVPLDEVVVTGRDERVRENMRRTNQSFLNNAMGVLNSPQTGMMELITGKQQTPSDAWGFDTTDNSWYHPKSISNFAMDAVLDPMNAIGVGIADDLTKGAIKEIAQDNISKSIKNSITPYGYSFQNITDAPKNIINYYKGEPKVIPSKLQKVMDKNPNIRNLVNETSKNREDAWSVYLGLKPDDNTLKLIGTDDATQLSKYELLSPRVVDKNEIQDYITSLNYGKINSNLKKIDINNPGSNVIDSDRIFGVMGGYSKSISPDGKSLMYRDTWDLQPLKSQKYLPESIRNFEVSSIVPGANPFVSEGKLADIKTKYSKPYYKSINNEIDERFSSPGVSDYLYDIADSEGIEAANKEYNNIRKNIIKDLISEKSKGQKISGYYSNKDQKYLDVSPYINIKKKRQGGVIKDNRGQWDHPGEITEIDSPYITMEDVPYPVLGISDVGDTKLMKPEKNYKFKGKKVTEYPILKNGGRTGINDLDAQPMKKLNQLLNFTNDPDNTNWLDKYN